MNIKFFGHNCFLIQNENFNLLIDPWLSEKGAFFGSWFQWPINHSYINSLIKNLKSRKKNYLYISHEHQDHYDIDTLNKIQPSIDECIIPDYYDNYLDNNLKKIGFKVNKLKDLEKFNFSKKDYIKLLIIDTGIHHDSAAIINSGGEIFFNQNDCKVFDRLSILKDQKIKYYAAQFSGATIHPVCYKMSKIEKKRISKKRIFSKLVAIKNAIKILKPEYYLPSAGPAVFPFLSDNFSLDRDNIFVHQTELEKNFQNINTKIMFLRPGDNTKNLNKTIPIKPPTKKMLDILKKNLVCEFNDKKNVKFNKNLLKKEIILRLNKIKDLNFEKCPVIILDWDEEKAFEINLNQKSVKEVDSNDDIFPKTFVHIKASKNFFNLLSNPKNRWQDIFLSFKCQINRKPDKFCTFINLFLFSDVSNIHEGFKTTLNINDERIIIYNPNNGKNYEINRFCPHNGADLKNAEFNENNNLICPRHSWLFDVENKGLCQNSNISINAKELKETISLCENLTARLLD